MEVLSSLAAYLYSKPHLPGSTHNGLGPPMPINKQEYARMNMPADANLMETILGSFSSSQVCQVGSQDEPSGLRQSQRKRVTW